MRRRSGPGWRTPPAPAGTCCGCPTGGAGLCRRRIGLTDVALADAAELLGRPLIAASSVVDSAVVRWTSALPAPRPGHADAVRTLRAALRPLRLAIVGAAVAGSGLAGVVADATVQASGRRLRTLDAVAGIAGGSPRRDPPEPGRR